MKFVKRIVDAASGAGPTRRPPDADFETLRPALFEYLTATTWEDGTERKTSTVTFFSDDGCWKCSLNERESGHCLFGTGSTLDQCLDTLESLLESEAGAPWRKSRQQSPTPQKGPKKS